MTTLGWMFLFVMAGLAIISHQIEGLREEIRAAREDEEDDDDLDDEDRALWDEMTRGA